MSKWLLKIEKVENGYHLTGNDLNMVIDEEKGELEALQSTLWNVMSYFGMQGSKHDAERIYVEIRKKSDE